MLQVLDDELLKVVTKVRAEAAAGVEADDLIGGMAALVDPATNKPAIPDQLIIDECKTFLVAGQVRTSSSISHRCLAGGFVDGSRRRRHRTRSHGARTIWRRTRSCRTNCSTNTIAFWA